MRAFCLFLMLAALQAKAQLRLPPFFSDNMVLQRGRPIHFWGRGVSGERVTIRFSGATRTVLVKPDSSWSLFFPRQPANPIAQNIIIASRSESLTLKNILIGDVWICSGQSNMEFPFEREAHAATEYARAAEPVIRFANPAPAGRYVYGVRYTDSLTRRLNADSFYRWDGWQNCDSSTIGPMSAVAYYFAKKLVAETHIPIGLINVSIGGAPLETFISRSALAASPRFAAKVKAGNWLDNDALSVWARERGRQNIAGAYRYGDDRGPNHAYKPGFAFDCGLRPLLPMPVKGILWYQGESNSLESDRVKEYPALLHLMIDDYRAGWRDPDLSFYWVQLSSIDTVNYQSRYWPEFRDGQRQLLAAIKHGGMAVCSDIGAKENVHPTNKKDVGERLARWVLYQDYHLPVIPSGPLPLRARYIHGEVVVDFRYGDGLRTSDGGGLREISLDGKHDTYAMIDGATIRIPAAEEPASVYYGWQPFSRGNLVNAEGLPASTFKIDVQ
ncbi:MAG TPA: sialate O-acetylesterase [Puia sp.]|nr:sialate O-acetylesterase [Puia sp.]